MRFVKTKQAVKKKKYYRLLTGFLALLLGIFLLHPGTAKAAGEKVYFGSESYEWTLDANVFLGVYASSDQTLDHVEMTIRYDADMLEFQQGGELVEPGLVKLDSTGVKTKEFKRMLSFKTKMSGMTVATIENSVLTLQDGTQQTMAETEVPIQIQIPESCKLSSIKVNGTALNGFRSDLTRYTMAVGSEIEKAEIETEPSDVYCEISDTTLQQGENVISVIAENDKHEKAKYMLYVNRAEKVQEADTAQNGQETVTGDSNQNAFDGEVQNSKASQYMTYLKTTLYAHKKEAVATGVIILVLIILCIISVNRRKRKKEEQIWDEKKTASEWKPRAVNIGTEANDIPFRLETLEQPRQMQQKDFLAEEKEIEQEVAELTKDDFSHASNYMEPDTVEIDVQHVTIDFKREKDESSSVKELVIRTLKRQRSVSKFRALDDISFQVMKGEVVGIIGTNGSGKSTILKIISGVLKPTKGTITVDKSKIQLLTLGTGFDMELTGRENVYLNGAIIGYTKEYIDEKYEDIVKFAELEGFMDDKVKNYSSGMVSRLGFAIATVRDTPEILILDEVLSVGDMFFRKKSEKRIQEMIHGGSTVLIVSHSPSVIRKNCTKVVWIEKGRLKAVGNPKTVCAAYEKMQQGV